MKEADKARQLRNHKILATGLFLLMAGIYILMVWLLRSYPQPWMGYVRAFSEAGMVGALADWFAVTALFHHPLGLPIPHTNLIEKSKQRIGDNLGSFVVDNFLQAATIRPYILRLKVSALAGQWLQQEKNRRLLLSEMARLLEDILRKTDDKAVAGFVAQKGSALLQELKLGPLLGNALHYFLERKEQEKLITALAGKISEYISGHRDLVREKVRSESYFFIPGFIDNKLAEKISDGLASYFRDVQEDPGHHVRAEIAQQLYRLAGDLSTQGRWEEELQHLKEGFLSAEKLELYARDIWHSLRASLLQELADERSALRTYFMDSLSGFADNLSSDPAMQQKIDHWVRLNGYRYILRNRDKVGQLISSTVGNWQGRELSSKLETEVGKDLQYIRINGTLVGGLVGLLIYTLTRLLG